MGSLAATNVVALLADDRFVEELIEAILGDPTFREVVADEAAAKLEDLIDDDPRFHLRLAEEFLSDRRCKRRVLHRLADNLS